VPHFSGGTLTGRVIVDDHSTADHRPRDLATVVGLVEQNPVSTFVTDVVEDEIAYGMETMGLDPTTIRRRVEETLDLFGLTPLRTRPLGALSGGQQQRLPSPPSSPPGRRSSCSMSRPRLLDPVAAEEVLASLHRIVHDLGVTVVLAEHRLERVVHHADRVILIDGGRTSALLDPAEAMADSPIHPPLVACRAWPGGHRPRSPSATRGGVPEPCGSASPRRCPRQAGMTARPSAPRSSSKGHKSSRAGRPVIDDCR
jgi:energy-coupling factor transport system ATP-binding protein